MGFMDAVKTCFSKYATFSGRARRSEYWWFVLFNIVVSIAIAAVFPPHIPDMMTAGGGGMEAYGAMAPSLASSLWSLAVLLPGLAVSVRRLHDGNKTGWWLLIAFIPLIGAIILLVWFASRGTPGDNAYGSDPLAGQPA